MDLLLSWAELAVNDGRYEEAVRFLVSKYLNAKSPANVWKWWKRSFRMRPDYPQMTERFLSAMLTEYQTGGKWFKETVATMLGLDKRKSMLPVNEIVQVLRRKKILGLSVQGNFEPASPAPSLAAFT